MYFLFCVFQCCLMFPCRTDIHFKIITGSDFKRSDGLPLNWIYNIMFSFLKQKKIYQKFAIVHIIGINTYKSRQTSLKTCFSYIARTSGHQHYFNVKIEFIHLKHLQVRDWRGGEGRGVQEGICRKHSPPLPVTELLKALQRWGDWSHVASARLSTQDRPWDRHGHLAWSQEIKPDQVAEPTTWPRAQKARGAAQGCENLGDKYRKQTEWMLCCYKR